MGFLNRSTFIGRVKNITVAKTTNSGSVVINFDIEVVEVVGHKNIHTVVHCMAFNKDAQFISDTMQDGDECYIEGKMRTNSFNNSLKLMVDSIQARSNGRKAS